MVGAKFALVNAMIPGKTALKVLVVDDDVEMRQALSDCLGRNSCFVESAGTANEALDKMRQEDYHTVITDIVLPGGSGLEVVQKGKELNPGTAFIVITGTDTAEYASEARKLGAIGYLVKPFDLTELLSLIFQHQGQETKK